MPPVDRAFTEQRIANLKAIILAYDAAELFFAQNGAVESYDLDTGQSRQKVTRANLAAMRAAAEKALKELLLELSGGSVIRINPDW